MANKIVQLQDEDGNAVFPIAGGVSGGSITNSSIADGTVTADKLNLSYSTSEQATGETWIDGKMIYRKTINIGTLPNNTSKLVDHGINNLDYIIEFYGVAYNPTANSGTGAWQKIPLVAADNSNVSITFRRTQIAIVAARDASGYTTTYVTVYYTKSS